MNDFNLIISKFNDAGGIPQLPEIKNDNDFSKASDTYAFLQKYFNAAEKSRKEEVAPLVEQKREIDGRYKEFTTPIEKASVEIKKMMTVYSVTQQQAQKLLEADAIAEAVINGEDNVIVDALDVTKNQSEFSSSSLNEVTKFRFKNLKLNEVIEIPISKFKAWLENNTCPDYIESYKEAQMTIRKKF